jgi:hypothetical protein
VVEVGLDEKWQTAWADEIKLFTEKLLAARSKLL